MPGLFLENLLLSFDNRETCFSENDLLYSADDEHYCHNEERTTTNTKARKKLIIASILCIIFMIGEIIGKFLKIVKIHKNFILEQNISAEE